MSGEIEQLSTNQRNSFTMKIQNNFHHVNLQPGGVVELLFDEKFQHLCRQTYLRNCFLHEIGMNVSASELKTNFHLFNYILSIIIITTTQILYIIIYHLEYCVFSFLEYSICLFIRLTLPSHS